MKKSWALIVALVMAAAPASAADKLRIANSQKGFWDTTLPLFAIEKGLYKEQGIDAEMTWTDGGSDAMQAVISGSFDIVIGGGMLAALGAWSKGAPIEIMSSYVTGGGDIAFYVKGDSPYRSIKDLEGKSIGINRPGGAIQLIAGRVTSAAKVNVKEAITGGVPSTLTAVMSDQVAVGWMTPPSHAALLEKGEIRILFTGNDAPGMENQTIRLIVGNREWIRKNEDLARRVMAVQRKMIAWAYDTDEPLKLWADMHKITLEQARALRDKHYPRKIFQLAEIQGVSLTEEEALETKRIARRLTDDERAKLVAYVKKLNQ